MTEARKRLWEAHCHRMAEMSYAIADWCEDSEMMSAYVMLGARWVQLAGGPPGAKDDALAPRPAAKHLAA